MWKVQLFGELWRVEKTKSFWVQKELSERQERFMQTVTGKWSATNDLIVWTHAHYLIYSWSGINWCQLVYYWCLIPSVKAFNSWYDWDPLVSLVHHRSRCIVADKYIYCFYFHFKQWNRWLRYANSLEYVHSGNLIFDPWLSFQFWLQNYSSTRA